MQLWHTPRGAWWPVQDTRVRLQLGAPKGRGQGGGAGGKVSVTLVSLAGARCVGAAVCVCVFGGQMRAGALARPPAKSDVCLAGRARSTTQHRPSIPPLQQNWRH